MKRRPAFPIILVVFNTILLRPLNIFLTWKHMAARGVVRKNMAGYKTTRVAEISLGAAHKRHPGSNKSACLITTRRQIIYPELFWLADGSAHITSSLLLKDSFIQRFSDSAPDVWQATGPVCTCMHACAGDWDQDTSSPSSPCKKPSSFSHGFIERRVLFCII